MKKMAKVAALVLVLATLMSLGQATVVAAPAQPVSRTSGHVSGSDRFQGLMRLLAAVWGDRGAIWGNRGAIWGNRTAVWGGK